MGGACVYCGVDEWDHPKVCTNYPRVSLDRRDTEAAGWSLAGEMAAMVGYKRGGSPDFGEVDAVHVRRALRDLLAELESAKAEVDSEKMARYRREMDAMDDAAAARAEARSMRLLVHALLRRLGTDDVELSTAEVEKATELRDTMEIATINRPGWSHPLRVESKPRQDGS